jgi:hypothetical protein
MSQPGWAPPPENVNQPERQPGLLSRAPGWFTFKMGVFWWATAVLTIGSASFLGWYAKAPLYAYQGAMGKVYVEQSPLQVVAQLTQWPLALLIVTAAGALTMRYVAKFKMGSAPR